MNNKDFSFEVINKIMFQLQFSTGHLTIISLSDNFDKECDEVQMVLNSLTSEQINVIDNAINQVIDEYMTGGISDWCIFD